MEQVKNSMTLDILQTVAAPGRTSRTGGKADGGSDFQKLMDKAAANGKDAKAEEAPKTETPNQDKAEAASPDKTGTPTAGKKPEAPVRTEDPLARIRKLLEQGAIAFQPNIGIATLDGQTYQPGEYVEVWTRTGSVEFIPVTGLDESQLRQLQQLLESAASVRTIDVEDPEADAMLELTDPTVDHSPAALLEKVVAEQLGTAAEKTVEAVRPETEVKVEAEAELEAAVEVKAESGVQNDSLIDNAQDDPAQKDAAGMQQAPQPLFRDVKAAPVKVGEVYDASRTEEPNVAEQVDAGVAQALEKGESMVRIQLNPANLGSVTVEITRNTEGIIHVALSARSGETRNLLERHAGELQGLLSSRTQQNVEVNVQRQQESQQNQNHNHDQNQNYDGRNGHAQDGGRQRRQQQEQSGSQDFIQQLRLGLIPVDGDE